MSNYTFRGGVHPEENKEFSRESTFRVYEAKGEMIFPLGQHIGKPARPLVKRNEQVLAGQVIAEADGFVSANIVSSCSGKVKDIGPRQTVSGKMAECIVITNDGKFEQLPGIGEPQADYNTLTPQEILGKIKAAGIVGMGGAGFPTHVKLAPRNPEAIKYVIANGAECEPYITCDDQLMRGHAKEIVEGVKIILKLFPNAVGVIGIEENKPEAIEAMQMAAEGDANIHVLTLKTKYPQGGERSLISVVAGAHFPGNKLPADVGCVVDNVATIYAIYRAVCFNEPLMQRGVTISGDAIANPCNLLVRIGTSCKELMEEAGGIKEGVTCNKVLSGGPMMGIAMTSMDVPLQKANNAITFLQEDEVATAEQQLTACIRCGRCGTVCPLGLIPQMMAAAAEKKDYERYDKKLNGLDCIACGSCTFICPARRPLMQLFKQTKAEIMAERRAAAAKAAAEAAAKEEKK
ncbi:MAG: electron transport complex subunit RsxC [Lachnospiraceae bacterium]|nr:electron transport complex subunit RsxC [Lachnospiraceae bacterium]